MQRRDIAGRAAKDRLDFAELQLVAVIDANRLVDAMKTANPSKSVRTLSYGVRGLAQRNNVDRMVRLKQAIGGTALFCP